MDGVFSEMPSRNRALGDGGDVTINAYHVHEASEPLFHGFGVTW